MGNYAENRRAHFDYEVLEKYEAGIELLGFEVKSVRGGGMTLDGAFTILRGEECFLVGANIRPYQPKNIPSDYDPMRARKLLLTKKEISELGKNEKTSLTIVPLAVYNKGKKIKVSLAVVRGKKKFDKRDVIKKRESDREIRREYKAR